MSLESIHKALSEMEEREKAAYPGPWVQKFSFNVEGPDRRGICSTGGHSNNKQQERVHAENVGNGAFIAHSRQDLPKLIKALRVAVQAIDWVDITYNDTTTHEALAEISCILSETPNG